MSSPATISQISRWAIFELERQMVENCRCAMALEVAGENEIAEFYAARADMALDEWARRRRASSGA